MMRYRRWWVVVGMLLSLGFLMGGDVDCDDDDFVIRIGDFRIEFDD